MEAAESAGRDYSDAHDRPIHVPGSWANAVEWNHFQLCSKPLVISVGLEGHDCQRLLTVTARPEERFGSPDAAPSVGETSLFHSMTPRMGVVSVGSPSPFAETVLGSSRAGPTDEV